MSYAGIEYPDRHDHDHCGNTDPHGKHQIYTGGRNYHVCTGQLAAAQPTVEAPVIGARTEGVEPSPYHPSRREEINREEPPR
jgi:hypothetical protein